MLDVKRFYAIHTDDELLADYARDVIDLLDSIVEDLNTSQSSARTSRVVQAIMKGANRARISSDGRLNSQAVELVGREVLRTDPKYSLIRPEFYHYDEISASRRALVSDDTINRIDRAASYVDCALHQSRDPALTAGELLNEKYKTTNLALVWLANIAEEDWPFTIQREYARDLLTNYLSGFLEQNYRALKQYKALVTRIFRRCINEWKCAKHNVKLASLFTGFEFLSDFLNMNTNDVMLTRRMLQQQFRTIKRTRRLAYPQTKIFRVSNCAAKRRLKSYLAKELGDNDLARTRGVIFLDVASKSSTIQKYLIPLFCEWKIEVRFIFLRYVTTRLDGYNSLGLGTDKNYQITKLANVLDDGFPVATTSPVRCKANWQPVGVVATTRKWFHDKVSNVMSDLGSRHHLRQTLLCTATDPTPHSM